MRTQPSVVILTAGRATRMYPLTLQQPIALCSIAGVTLLARLLEQLKAAGIYQAKLSLPARANAIAGLAVQAAPRGFELDTFFPSAPADGQVGNVREAVAGSDAALVVYGDSFLSLDFQRLLASHAVNRARGALATIVYHRPKDLREADQGGRTYHGVMSVDAASRVTRFMEKPLVSELSADFALANAAVFVVEKELLERGEFAEAKNFSFDVFEPAVRSGLPLYGCDIGSGFRLDAGGITRWYELNLAVLSGQVPAPIPGSMLGPSVWVGDRTAVEATRLAAPVLVGARVVVGDGATLGPSSMIGDDCRIGAGVTIARSIVLDQCSIGNNVVLERCIIGANCKILSGVKLPPYSVIGPYSVLGQDDWPVGADG